jgi:hypothetical protein
MGMGGHSMSATGSYHEVSAIMLFADLIQGFWAHV